MFHTDASRSQVLSSVRTDGLNLQDVSTKFQGDREVVLAAVQADGNALAFASEELKDDATIVAAAVANTWRSLGYASLRLRGDPRIVRAATAQTGSALYLAVMTDVLCRDRAVLLESVQSNGLLLERAGSSLRDDRDLVLKAVEQNGLVLRYASDRLRADRWVVLASVSQEANALVFAAENLQRQAGAELRAFTEASLQSFATFVRLVLLAQLGARRESQRGNFRASRAVAAPVAALANVSGESWVRVASFAGVPVGWELRVLRGAARRRGWAAGLLPRSASDIHDVAARQAVASLQSPPRPRTASRLRARSGAEAGGVRPLVISGPSGVGKSTVIKALTARHPGRFGFSVSHTTRAPRPGEVNGVDYHFTSAGAMATAIGRGEMLEHAEVHGHVYGTSAASVRQVSSQGKICILDVNVHGAAALTLQNSAPKRGNDNRGSARTQANGSGVGRPWLVFLAPPSLESLGTRLRARGTEDEASLSARLGNAAAEIAAGTKPGAFDRVVVNADLDAAVTDLARACMVWYPQLHFPTAPAAAVPVETSEPDPGATPALGRYVLADAVAVPASGSSTPPRAKAGLRRSEHMSEVSPGLFVGDIDAAVSAVVLTWGGITHLVDLSNSFVDDSMLAEGGRSRNVHYEVLKEKGEWRDAQPMIQAKLVVRVDDVDKAPLHEHFDAINDFVRHALATGGGVLVHCFRGKSRSAASVVQFLMQEHGLSLKDALFATKTARPGIDINCTFKQQLMDLEAKLWPGKAPSIVLSLKSRKPVLTSAGGKTPPKKLANENKNVGGREPHL